MAVVPSLDSAGFFIALHEGLFARQGLHVRFIPAVSSETVINAQALGLPHDEVDISCGNYVSYIQAQENYDRGIRPTTAGNSPVAADLDIFAEGSVMQPGSQELFVMPGARILTLAGLEGKTIGVNAAGQHSCTCWSHQCCPSNGLQVSGVHFAYYPLPEMAQMLQAGKVSGGGAAPSRSPVKPRQRSAWSRWPIWTRAPPAHSPCRAALSPSSGRR